jgi:hypothetical protein
MFNMVCSIHGHGTPMRDACHAVMVTATPELRSMPDMKCSAKGDHSPISCKF